MHSSNFCTDGWPTSEQPVACVDLGGTKMAVTLVDANGLRTKVVEATVVTGRNDALAVQIFRLIDQACIQTDLAPEAIQRVGVASCGPFVLHEGLVELAAPNLCGGLTSSLPNDWKTVPLEALLRQKYPYVRVENDGVGALEAERRWGALRNENGALASCAFVTWSTGIGTGLCVDGHVLRGKNGNAGHAGHSFVSTDAHAVCGCGNAGDVEGLVGGSSIARRFANLGYPDAAALFRAAYVDEKRAIAIIDDLCDIMGRMLYNLIVTLDLQRISLGGSVYWHHRDHLLPRLRAVVQGRLAPLTSDCELVSAGLGHRVGDFGALALVA